MNIEVGDWVKWRYGREYGFTVSVVTEVNGEEIQLDNTMILRSLVTEVRWANKTTPRPEQLDSIGE